ncbi:biotin carboxylase N-terminal domain-containing protein [Algiphilus sp. W345]|uniref:Biotin carboxylase N-terminal domain-containing protein n=1 Tax=Banduia mediterranea TaxID=3075609 RepID=A0ABU2WE93_9GAMM|nr:biotin carboxylase N-terminal domain-containing protein [Algiphilus sp. W345]MDT0496193.1 biotin carboxylase N-terminal domain-containing protein [Algiphilus sp. W345]
MKPIRKVLIANRGEIACRIARTCRRLGMAVAGVHSSADARARHVREIGESHLIGDAAPAASYLNVEAIVSAAQRAGADAIHPGYGFVSENPAFVRAVEAAGLVFVGPTAETMERLGGKASAKREAQKLGIPTVPGDTIGLSDPARVAATVRDCGLPALLKAVAGGGGRGMALIETLDGLDTRIDSAMREAAQAFGSGEMIVERYLPEVRHIEVQVAGDGQGQAIHLFERECSLQRRHQKVIEEAPSAGLEPGLRARILEDARRLAAALRYRGLGTVEFIVAGADYYFLEVNPRLQVEHPVTEEVTGLDLVELQLRIAATGSLGLTQEQVQVQGHAFEVRIYAEDTDAGFLPGAGQLHWLHFPEALLRVESGVDSGDEITPFYDPMIAKLISRGDTRAEALERLSAGLATTDVVGLTTNVGFLRTLLAWPETVQGRMHTRLIDQRWAPGAAAAPVVSDEALAAVALDWLRRERARCDWGVWTRAEFSGWRTRAGAHAPSTQPAVILGVSGRSCAVHFSAPDASGIITLRLVEPERDRTLRARLAPAGDSAVRLETETLTRELRLFVDASATLVHDAQGSWRVDTTPPLAAAAAASVAESALKAPMMGKVVAVLAAEGDTVSAGQTVIVLESMKMELQVLAERGGRLGALRCAPGDMVGRGDVLCEVGD